MCFLIQGRLGNCIVYVWLPTLGVVVYQDNKRFEVVQIVFCEFIFAELVVLKIVFHKYVTPHRHQIQDVSLDNTGVY
jgi:hypothetical protein